MAFLDNSGDIILDAVLTDTGRYRLAQGDGSFKIAKFAVADDEINYASYNKTHASGSAYYDLDILQTPVLEGFTDNAAMLKSKLLTIAQNNILYMPILKLNDVFDPKTEPSGSGGPFLVAVDALTQEDIGGASGAISHTVETGVIAGFTPSKAWSSYIRVDQGLDTSEISPINALDSVQSETQYIVEIDNRLGSIASINGTVASPAFIDDDEIASYYFSLTSDDAFVENNTEDEDITEQVIKGPRGTFIHFKIKASLELQTSTFLFTKLGGKEGYKLAKTSAACANGYYYIDTVVRIVGKTTGSSLDVPLRFIKYDSVNGCGS